MSCGARIVTWLYKTSYFYVLHTFQYWKISLWYSLLIITNIQYFSTSKYKGEWTSCLLKIRPDYVTVVGQWDMSESDTDHFWAKALNYWGLTLQSSFLPEQFWKPRVKVEPTLGLVPEWLLKAELLKLDMSYEQEINICCFKPLRVWSYVVTAAQPSLFWLVHSPGPIESAILC